MTASRVKDGGEDAPGEMESLLAPVDPSLYATYRPTRDVAWAIAYLAYMGSLLIGGVYAYQHYDVTAFSRMDSDYLALSSHCPADRRQLRETDDADLHDAVDVHFWRRAATVGAVSVGAAAAAAALLLSVMLRHSRALVDWAFTLQAALMFASAAALLSVSAGAAFAYVLLGVLWLWLYYLWRDKLALVAKMFSVSAAGLAANKHMLTATLALNALLCAQLAALAAAVALAAANGTLQRVAGVRTIGDDATCVDAAGTAVPCCEWQAEAWVPPYVAMAAAGALWSVMLAFEMRVFVIAGTVSQWYFAPVHSPTNGTTLRALGHAAGASFGTLCLASLVLTAVQIVRSCVDRARRDRGNLLACLVQCVLNCVFALIEFLSKFATVYAAITGLGFCKAAREVTDLLQRNFLSSYAVWWLPSFVLNSLVLTAALVWGTAVALAFYLQVAHQPTATLQAALAGMMAGGLVATLLSFGSTIVLDVLNAVYVCFALDKDRACITRPEVHAIYVLLPSSCVTGVAVEPPAGEYTYTPPQPPPSAPPLPVQTA